MAPVRRRWSEIEPNGQPSSHSYAGDPFPPHSSVFLTPTTLCPSASPTLESMHSSNLPVLRPRRARALSPLKETPKRKREGSSLVTVERDQQARREKHMEALVAHLDAIAKMSMEKMIRKTYEKDTRYGLIRLKFHLYLGFHMVALPLPTITDDGTPSPKKVRRDERRYKEAYSTLLWEMFPASLGFHIREQVPATGEYFRGDAVDSVMLYIVFRKDVPLLMVEFKDPDVLKVMSGRLAADTQMRDRLRDAVSEMVPGITCVYGLSAIGLNVCFYRAYKRKDKKLIITPARVPTPADPNCLPHKDHLADQWLMKITDSKAVALLYMIRRNIIDMVCAALEEAPAVFEARRRRLRLPLDKAGRRAARAERKRGDRLIETLKQDAGHPFEGEAYVETYGVPEDVTGDEEEVPDEEYDNNAEYHDDSSSYDESSGEEVSSDEIASEDSD
ncbi:hypothetical protein L227DRAFT_617677 [Lentinus tigrinus ALCF2SS1-6]|uniref:Uncharacterized protein n=1 Tax=Lentinus tigrinus ALCF2SS1-6 TaxID=1328759 RepID=A0A5C2RNA5_9APHY|nr:hypothetical protein L227DRAFT_617677 [Lentinus tigrinus ALCF2SS1-6]